MSHTTPFERGFAVLRRASILAVLVSGVTLLVYAGGGVFLIEAGTLVLPYPHLSFRADPVLLFIVSAIGLFLVITMVAQIFLTLLVATSPEEMFVIVVLSSIGVGLGGAAFYYSLRRFLELVP